ASRRDRETLPPTPGLRGRSAGEATRCSEELMTKQASVGIKRLEGIHWYVHDLERSRQFYTGKLDFAETWRSSPDLEKQGRQKSACFAAGNIRVVCSSALPGDRQSR